MNTFVYYLIYSFSHTDYSVVLDESFFFSPKGKTIKTSFFLSGAVITTKDGLQTCKLPYPHNKIDVEFLVMPSRAGK